MVAINSLIIGVDSRPIKANGKSVSMDIYRLLLFKYGRGKDGTTEIGQMNKKAIPEAMLIQAIREGKLSVGNAAINLKTGKLEGTSGALSRFKGSPREIEKTLVIISEIRDLERKHLFGYKVVNRNGQVKNIKKSTLLEYCENCRAEGILPLQNGQYVEADDKQFIRGFKDNAFLVEYKIMGNRRNPHARTETPKPAPENEAHTKNENKLNDIFNEKQVEQLKLGKKNGVDIKIYGNPKFSAKQMEILRLTLENGDNASLFADPAYRKDLMNVYRFELSYGHDIRPLLNPKYNLGQISAIIDGMDAGVDISRYSNPSYTAEQMIEAEKVLERDVWKEDKNVGGNFEE